ncbi:putative glycoside hydrolase, family 32, glycosyl hydrolase family 32 [Septoria linicola]|nr:putative glycoside hydrolase, family 32, glycosyl hydrolase family 32 [Septoria linicola]
MADVSSSSSSSADLTPISSLEPSTTPSTPPASNKIFANKQATLSRQERFNRWRPSYHFIAASGWMNDPCGPGFDPKTGLYHISYQQNPNGVDWGDIAWGSATSPDLIHWTHQAKPSLSPDQPYDNKGVFTGCLINARDNSLTYAYTSVNQLPIHHTLEHVRGSESLALAKSFDSGVSWQKIDANPVLPSEPACVEVTGWRDPYVAAWPRMARFLGVNEADTLFGIVSGGIRDVTPTTFLYAIDANDLSKWSYIGPLANFGLNMRPSRWSGDLGKNWEVTNFTTIRDAHNPNVQRDLLVMGTEGCLPNRSPSIAGSFGPSRPARGQLWMSGSLGRPQQSSVSGAVEMTYNYGGHLDHGCLYAANSFYDPQSAKQIVWGWITEEDLCDDLRHAQGWSGLLAMPRELRMQTLRHVVCASNSDLSSITSIECEPDRYGSYTIRTLASQPYQPLIKNLRQSSGVRLAQLSRRELAGGTHNVTFKAQDMETSHWELDCMLKVSKRSQTVGFSIDHTGNYSRSTTLFFDQFSETFTINRPAFPVLNSSELINSAPERAPHTLFTMRDPHSGRVEQEPLHIRVWRDNSVLEVFVNGRTAISTRIYAAEETFGLRFFADDAPDGIADVPSELISATLWDNIGIS